MEVTGIELIQNEPLALEIAGLELVQTEPLAFQITGISLAIAARFPQDAPLYQPAGTGSATSPTNWQDKQC